MISHINHRSKDFLICLACPRAEQGVPGPEEDGARLKKREGLKILQLSYCKI